MQRATAMCNISLRFGMALLTVGPTRLLTISHMQTYVILLGLILFHEVLVFSISIVW